MFKIITSPRKSITSALLQTNVAPKHARVTELQAWIAAPDAAHRPKLP